MAEASNEQLQAFHAKMRGMTARGERAKGIMGLIQSMLARSDARRAGGGAIAPGAPTPAPAAPAPTPAPVAAPLPTDALNVEAPPANQLPAGQIGSMTQPSPFQSAFRDRIQMQRQALTSQLGPRRTQITNSSLSGAVGRFIR